MAYKQPAEAHKVIPEEIEKIVVSTQTMKALLKKEYGREVESIKYDVSTEEWTVDFLIAAEKQPAPAT